MGNVKVHRLVSPAVVTVNKQEATNANKLAFSLCCGVQVAQTRPETVRTSIISVERIGRSPPQIMMRSESSVLRD
jgi:hypothetical protein